MGPLGPLYVPHWPQGLILGPRSSFLDPRTKIWTWDLEIGLRLARGGFGGKNGGWTNTVLWRNGFEIGDGGVSRDQNGLYGTQEAFGKASFPPNPSKTCFSRLSPILGNLGRVPLAPLCISYGPFVGLPCLGSLWCLFLHCAQPRFCAQFQTASRVGGVQG